jgi:Cof subfamily protein (haloacid dehalogenase superfamily)
MYKMITIDVDDTLLNDQRIVTEATRTALAQAMERGAMVTLATGRMFASAKQIAKQIQLNVPLITYQGAYVKNLLDEEILYARFVPEGAAEQVYDYATKHRYHLQVYHEDRLYAREENQKIQDYARISKVPYFIEPNFARLLKKPLNKLLIYEEPAVLDHIAEDLRVLLGDTVYITKSKPYFLEILHKEGTKGHAVEFLAQHFDCQLSQVIAIGDSWNDREMIRTAGLGVAMGNAVEPLKQIADFITKTNNEDGVKYVIDQFILKQPCA